MHILATGMNPSDANALRRKPRVYLFQAFVEAMRWLQDDGQHAITWRRVKVGDPLPPGTDAVIVSSMLPRSLNCPYALGVMWTISEALRLEIPLVLYLTDWAFFRAETEFRSIHRAGEEYFYKKIGGHPQYDEPPELIAIHAEALLEMCRQYADGKSNLWEKSALLVPRFTNWGNPAIVDTFLPGPYPVNTMDPTPLFLEYMDADPNPKTIPDMMHRHKRWILPSLLTDDTWLDRQHLTWPVDRFGPKRETVLVDEREVNEAYTYRIGALCPPYPTVGSGWWRSRWIHSMRAGTVLLCDPYDAKKVGPAYQLSGSRYESMSTLELHRTAQEQQETMEGLLQRDIGVLREQIHAAFTEAGA